MKIKNVGFIIMPTLILAMIFFLMSALENENILSVHIFFEGDATEINAVRLREINGENFLFLPHWAMDAKIISHGELPEFTTMFGSQIPTIFIQTESGGLDYIHADKNNRENVNFLFVNEHGVVEHSGAGDMNGRGNYTWLQQKRPYNFRLERGTSIGLFGMGEGRHWTLLANYMDDLRVRNTVALNLAHELEISHTSQIRPVDVFINSEYAGLFDLVERRSINHAIKITDLEAATAAVNVTRLSSYPHEGVHSSVAGTIKYFDIPNNPADITGGYLLEIQFPRRYMHDSSGFVSDRGAFVNIKAPEHATLAQAEYISQFFQRIEDAVYSGEDFRAYLDVHSFAIMYLFQEFLMNVDVANSSFFMYKESDDLGSGRLYAGPPWDFDFTLGALGETLGVNFRDPHLWWAKSGYIDNDPQNEPHLMNALYRNEIFREYVNTLWQSEVAPAIRILVGLDENEHSSLRSIDCYIEDVYASRSMERLFYPLPTGARYSYQSSDLTGFARERFYFLDNFWGE
jgi:hypothetical protein